jgi:hypothetical protein
MGHRVSNRAAETSRDADAPKDKDPLPFLPTQKNDCLGLAYACEFGPGGCRPVLVTGESDGREGPVP